MNIWTWILDQPSYADLYLDDISPDPGWYSAVLETDLTICQQAEFVCVHASRSAQCQPVGNSYFSRSASRSSWPMSKPFEVVTDSSLAIAPRVQGKQSVKRCMCRATKTGKAHIIVNMHESSLSLSVECSNLPALKQEASVQGGNQNAPMSVGREGDAMVSAMAPGFYVIPDGHVPELRSDRKEIRFRDAIKDEDRRGNSYTPKVAAKATGMPVSPERHVACTLSWGTWACCCQRWDAAVISMRTSRGISRRALNVKDPNPLKHPLAGLFVAIGMLVLFSGLALAGALTRRYLEKRARVGVARAAELWEASADELDTRPRYVSLLQRLQIVCTWGKWVADRFNQKQSQATELNIVQEGSGPRKLQKTKGTRFEDPSDLGPQFMPPASAFPVERAIDQSFGSPKRPENGTSDNMDQGSAEYSGGISTAQEHRSRNAPTRRSNRSTSVSDGQEENL